MSPEELFTIEPVSLSRAEDDLEPHSVRRDLAETNAPVTGVVAPTGDFAAVLRREARNLDSRAGEVSVAGRIFIDPLLFKSTQSAKSIKNRTLANRLLVRNVRESYEKRFGRS